LCVGSPDIMASKTTTTFTSVNVSKLTKIEASTFGKRVKGCKMELSFNVTQETRSK